MKLKFMTGRRGVEAPSALSWLVAPALVFSSCAPLQCPITSVKWWWFLEEREASVSLRCAVSSLLKPLHLPSARYKVLIEAQTLGVPCCVLRTQSQKQHLGERGCRTPVGLRTRSPTPRQTTLSSTGCKPPDPRGLLSDTLGKRITVHHCTASHWLKNGPLWTPRQPHLGNEFCV